MTLKNWVRAHRVARATANDPGVLNEDERVELKRLREDILELKTDREMLRRAAAYFARETMR